MKDVVGGFERVKAVLIGGPGFCGNDFYGFMVEKAKGEVRECFLIWRNNVYIYISHTTKRTIKTS